MLENLLVPIYSSWKILEYRAQGLLSSHSQAYESKPLLPESSQQINQAVDQPTLPFDSPSNPWTNRRTDWPTQAPIHTPTQHTDCPPIYQTIN